MSSGIGKSCILLLSWLQKGIAGEFFKKSLSEPLFAFLQMIFFFHQNTKKPSCAHYAPWKGQILHCTVASSEAEQFAPEPVK